MKLSSAKTVEEKAEAALDLMFPASFLTLPHEGATTMRYCIAKSRFTE